MEINNNNMKHDHNRYYDHDESPPPVAAATVSDDSKYSELLELMVKFGKKEMKDVEEETGRMISLIDWLEKSHKLEGLRAMRARVVDQLKSRVPRHLVSFWFLITLMYSEDKQVIAAKYRQFMSSHIAIDDLCDHVENYSELMDLAGTELKKIKEQNPNQVGIMATASELHSTTELFLSFNRGLKSLLFKIKLMELHLLYPYRPELQKLVDRMLSSVEGEVEQYEQELEVAGAKVKQVLKENLKKNAVEEKKEGDDDATANEQLQLRSLELKVREWLNIVKSSQENEKEIKIAEKVDDLFLFL